MRMPFSIGGLHRSDCCRIVVAEHAVHEIHLPSLGLAVDQNEWRLLLLYVEESQISLRRGENQRVHTAREQLIDRPGLVLPVQWWASGRSPVRLQPGSGVS
jgi:hypothetical protein